METEITAALIGVGATVAGTILGWVLNNLSNRGKLDIYFSAWKDKFQKLDRGVMTFAETREQATYYGYTCSIDIYNSSNETRIMRDIQIVFCSDRTVLHTFSPLDDSTLTQGVGMSAAHYDKFSVLNIPPKSVFSTQIHNGIGLNSQNNDAPDFIWETNNILIRYKNEKNKTKTQKIKNVNFKDYFNSRNIEGDNNG